MRVGVLIAFAMSQALRAGIVCIAQVLWHRESAARTHIIQSGVDRSNHCVALVSCGDIKSSFGNGNARFGPADELGRLMSRIRENQSTRICQTDVLSGANDDSPRNKARVFTGFNHLCEPVKCGVGITAAH